MTAVRIVGIGSPHGADRAGWVAIEALQDAGLATRYPAGMLSLLQCSVPARLPGLLAGSQCAIVIDALPGTPACVQRMDAGRLQQRADLRSVHGIGVGEMLALVEALEVQPPVVTVVAVGCDPQTSPATTAEQLIALLLPDLSRCIEQVIGEYLAT